MEWVESNRRHCDEWFEKIKILKFESCMLIYATVGVVQCTYMLGFSCVLL